MGQKLSRVNFAQGNAPGPLFSRLFLRLRPVEAAKATPSSLEPSSLDAHTAPTIPSEPSKPSLANCLPIDLIISILTHHPGHSTQSERFLLFRSACLVNSSWNVAATRFLYARVDLVDFPSIRLFFRTIRSSPDLASMVSTFNILASTYSPPPRGALSLKTKRAGKTPWVGYRAALDLVLTSFPNLSDLSYGLTEADAGHTSTVDLGREGKQILQRLRCLRLWGRQCQPLVDAVLGQSGVSLTNIEELEINSFEWWDMGALAHFPNLGSLILARTTILSAISSVRDIPSLKQLTLMHCVFSHDGDWPRFTRLRKLVLGHWDGQMGGHDTLFFRNFLSAYAPLITDLTLCGQPFPLSGLTSNLFAAVRILSIDSTSVRDADGSTIRSSVLDPLHASASALTRLTLDCPPHEILHIRLSALLTQLYAVDTLTLKNFGPLTASETRPNHFVLLANLPPNLRYLRVEFGAAYAQYNPAQWLKPLFCTRTEQLHEVLKKPKEGGGRIYTSLSELHVQFSGLSEDAHEERTDSSWLTKICQVQGIELFIEYC